MSSPVPSLDEIYSAWHKKRYKPKFIFKEFEINFFRFFLEALKELQKMATKLKEFDQFVLIL